MKRAVIYARVSSRKQADDGVSMDAQIEQCTARAQQLGATVVRVFRDDGISGRTTKARPGFLAAIDYCETAGIDLCVVWSTSRFARNAVDLWVHHDRLTTAGTRLECLNADIDDTTDAGFINRVFLGAMDQMVSRQIGRDTLRSMKRSAADGFFTGGRVPFGYQVVPDGKRGRLQPLEPAASAVRRAFALCLDGLGGQAIASCLNDAGMLRNTAPWKKTTVLFTLSNPVYSGTKTFNRKDRKTGRDKPRADWVQVQSHPALVTPSDFEKAQTMLEDRTPPRKEQGGTPRSQFIFSGLLTCGVCGGALVIINGTSRNHTLYNYYGCTAHKKGAAHCLLRNFRADLFDDWLLGEILEQVVTPDVMRQAVQDLSDMGGRWAQEREAQRVQLVKSLRELEAKRGKLYDLLETHGKDTPDLSDVTDRLRLRNGEIKAVQARLERLEEAPKPSKVSKVDPALAVQVMRDVVRSGDAQKKRAFLGAFLRGVTVSSDRVTVDYQAEALVGIGHPAGVRSGESWLPVNTPLRTKTLEILRPFMLLHAADAAAVG